MKDTSKAAFARPIGERITETTRYYNNASPGMSLREYYAGQALAAMISAGSNWHEEKATAKIAIKHADALIAELEGGE